MLYGVAHLLVDRGAFMGEQYLSQLGMDLQSGTAHRKDFVDSGKCLGSDKDISANSDRPLDHFVSKSGKVFAGTHLIIDLVGCVEGLDDPYLIEQALRRAVDLCKATLLHIHLHRFSPHGVSGVAVLAESHISVHTWPEMGYAAFDVFMCGDARPWLAVDVLKEFFSPNEVKVKEFFRGEDIQSL